MSALDTSAVVNKFAIAKPSVAGAAFRIYLLGGSPLSDVEKASASGSAHIFNTHRAAINGLVEELEKNTKRGAS